MGNKYTYINSPDGPRYEFLGTAAGAGTAKLRRPLCIYKSLSTGTLYYRDVDDFLKRMAEVKDGE